MRLELASKEAAMEWLQKSEVSSYTKMSVLSAEDPSSLQDKECFSGMYNIYIYIYIYLFIFVIYNI